MKNKWLRGDNSVNIHRSNMPIVYYHFAHCYLSINQVSFNCQKKFSPVVPNGRTDGPANTVFVSFFAATDAFMSLHKHILTLTQTPFMRFRTVFIFA